MLACAIELVTPVFGRVSDFALLSLKTS